MNGQPDEILDLREFLGPVALLEVTNVFRGLHPNQIVEIIVGDLGMKKEIFKVLKAFSYELVKVDEHETFCRIFLKKIGP